ncbi:MAG: ABC transporter substrate-binding protein [Elusimicrobiales bacterium]|jgi:iron complex transport system substrate-binding protein
MRHKKTSGKTLPAAGVFAILGLCAFSGHAQAKRVVSLLPSYTEIIFELGAGTELAGVSTYCDWPPGAREITKVGDYLRPNLEKIYSLKPDLVFAGTWQGSSVAQDLRNAGMKVVELPEERRVEDIYRTIGLIAAELDRKKEAAALIKKMKAGLKSGPAGTLRPLIYLEVDEGGWTVGARSFLSDAIERAGGRNIFAGEEKGYFQASWEAVVKKDPAAVLLLSGSASDFGRRPLAAGLKAVRNGRVFTGLDRDAFSRPGPRLAAEIRKLKDWLRESGTK